MHISVRWSLAFALAVAGCNGSPANPAAPAPPAVVQKVAVRIEGKVINADSGDGISGAALSFDGGTAGGPRITKADTSSPVTFTDESGAFVLEWMLPVGWRSLVIGVQRDTFLGTISHVDPEHTTNGVVRLYPELTIRAGESLVTHVSVGSYVCFDEGWPCRRIFVDIREGPVDLEAIPLDGQGTDDMGLVANPGIIAIPAIPPRRLTVDGPEVYIYGTGRVQLRASRPPQ